MEDADQNVDRDENPKPGEKDHNISSNPLICATARGGDLPRHLSSSPGGRWKWCVWVTACGQYPGRSSCATSRSRQPSGLCAERGSLQAQDAVLVIKIKHHSTVVTSPLLHQRGKFDQHLRPPGETEARDHPDLSDLGMTGAPGLGAAPSSAGPDHRRSRAEVRLP
jgi:hypothetical protein